MTGLAVTPRNRREAVELRLAWAESELTRGAPYGAVSRGLCSKFNLSRRQSTRYLAHIFARWRRESTAATRDEARDRLRAMATAAFERAMARTRAVTLLEGDGSQRLVEHPDPDLNAARGLLEIMGRLEGVLESKGGAITVHNNTALIGDQAIATLRAFYIGGTQPEPLPPTLVASNSATSPESRTGGAIVEAKP